MKRIIAVNSNCYHGYSIEDAIDGIAAEGFRYIELTATKGWTEHVFPTQSFERLCGVKDRLKKAGLTPFAMSGHCNLMDPDRIPDFIMNMRLAHFFEARYIVSSVGEAHLADKAVADDRHVAAQLKALVPALEEYGLTLVLEVHGDHGTGAVLRRIVKLVDSPLVKINYDTANAIFYGGADPAADLSGCLDEVAYLHLKDKAGAAKEWNFPALGEGSIDFPRIFRLLKDEKNDSPFSVEIEFTPEGSKDLAQVNEAVRTSAQYLTSHGFTL